MKVCSEEEFALSSHKKLPENKCVNDININLEQQEVRIKPSDLTENSVNEPDDIETRLGKKIQSTNRDYKVEDLKFYSESQKQEKLLNINLLRKLDEKIDEIKKNKASLDIFEAIAESTIKMCMEKNENMELSKENVNYNEEFYNQIEKDLLQIESQI